MDARGAEDARRVVAGRRRVGCVDGQAGAGDTADVVGFACFEVIEVDVTPEKIIRGRFLCPDLHPQQFEECMEGLGPTGTGGENFGVRADRPVLVR